MQPMLVIDVVKAGKKGMSWGKHKYIARILLSNGEYAYIHPDDDEGHFEHINGQWHFRLAPGKSLAAIINRHLWGGYIGETNKAGIPKAPDGLFRTYVIISNKALEMRKKGLLTREEEAAGTKKVIGAPFPNALSKERVGDYTIFTFAKVPVVGHDTEGKKRYGGYTHIDWNAAVIGQYKYTETKELLNHRVTEPEEIAAAQRFHDYIKEGGGSGDANTLAGTSTPQGQFKNPPKTTTETQAALGVSLRDSDDPLPIAKLLRDRLNARISKKNKGKVGAAVAAEQSGKIEKFPQDMIDRYGDEETLLNALRERPATTLISLGVITPTRHSKALLERVSEEWRRDIVRGSRTGWEAHKWTKLYDEYKKKDERDGLDMTDENSRLRKLRSQLSSDLINEGFEHLQRVVLSHDPARVRRLDSYIATSLRNHMNRLSAQWARNEQLTAPLVEEHNIEEAAHRNRQTAPFNPQDAAELARLTPVALHAINRVLNTQNFPDTLRRVVMERLYLNASNIEAADIAVHEHGEAEKRTQAEQSGTSYKRTSRSMYREWEEVAHTLKTVIDPDTGKEVDLLALGPKWRDRKLLQWFTDGVEKIAKELSIGLDPKILKDKKALEKFGKQHGFGVVPQMLEINASPSSYTYAEKMFHATMKTKKKVPRLLTNEGQAVRRYFELEAKLAGTARQHGSIKEALAREAYPDIHEREVDISTRPVFRKLPEHKTGPVKHVLLIPAKHDLGTSKPLRSMSPAVGFFSASQNQQLAAKLGIQLHNLRAGTGAGGAVWTQPNISLGKQAQRELHNVETHYTQLQKYGKAPLARLEQAYNRNKAVVKELSKLGTWVRNERTHQNEWQEKDSGLSALHKAALDLQSANNRIRQKKDARAALRAEFKEARQSVGTIEEHAHLNDSVLANKLKQHELTDEDKAAHAKALAAYQKISNRIGALVPEVKDLYDNAIIKNKMLPNELLSHARAHVTTVVNSRRAQQALIEFEKERRVTLSRMKKSWMPASSLVEAIYDYDFEFSRFALTYDDIIKEMRDVQHPGSRGGKWHRGSKGEVVYDVGASNPFHAKKDPIAHQAHKLLQDIKPKNKHEALKHLEQFVTDKKSGDIHKDKHALYDYLEHHVARAHIRAQADKRQKENAETRKRRKMNEREAVMRIGGRNRIGGEDEKNPVTPTKKETEYSPSPDHSIMVIGGHDAIRGEEKTEEEPKPKGTTSIWQPGDDERRVAAAQKRGSGRKPLTNEEWYQEQIREDKKRKERAAAIHSKQQNLTDTDKKKGKEAQQQAQRQSEMRRVARELPDEDFTPFPGNGELPEAKIKMPDKLPDKKKHIFARLGASFKRLFI